MIRFLRRIAALFKIPPKPAGMRTYEDVLEDAFGQQPPGPPTKNCVPFNFYVNGGCTIAHYHTVKGMRIAYEGSRCPHLPPVFPEVNK